MNPLMIANTQIRLDAAGRYCLNDLHQASGGESRHKPGNWLMLSKTKELAQEWESQQGLLEIQQAPIETVNDGFGNGTYAVKELVYAYAMWISAAFHLHVIRAYDALVQQRQDASVPLSAQPQHRADQLVSASRIFSAAFRAARQARMQYPVALQAAAGCAQRHTGIDWQAELGQEFSAPPPVLPDPFATRVQDALAGRNNFQMAAFIAEHQLGPHGDTGVMARVGRIAQSLGWVSRRKRSPSGGFFTEWYRRENG